MKVELQENKVIIDSKLEVTPKGLGYQFKYPGQFGNFVTIGEPLGSEVDTDRIEKQHNGSWAYKPQSPKYDPHVYNSWTSNGLTLEESVDRAFQRVFYEQLNLNTAIDKSWRDDIKATIRKMIERGDGRDSVYRVAGAIVKAYKQGLYRGAPFSVIFDAVVEGKIHNETTLP